MRFTPLFTAFILLSLACTSNKSGNGDLTKQNEDKPKAQYQNYDTAYFASGCFWCVEAIYECVKGVEEAVSGYAGGSKKNPSYKAVARGNTNHAETVKVYYDPEKVTYKTLVKVYYGSQDPTTVGQDPDFGEQYRSIIFYSNNQEKQIAQNYKDSLSSTGNYEDPIVTEVKKINAFYEASEYHQDYKEKHPNKRYIQQVSNPRQKRFTKAHSGLVKDECQK